MFLSTFTIEEPGSQRGKVPCPCNTVSKWCSTNLNPSVTPKLMIILLPYIASQHMLDSVSGVLDTPFSYLAFNLES